MSTVIIQVNSVINLVTSRLSKIALCTWYIAMLLRCSWPHVDLMYVFKWRRLLKLLSADMGAHRHGHGPPGKFEKCYRVKKKLSPKSVWTTYGVQISAVLASAHASMSEVCQSTTPSPVRLITASDHIGRHRTSGHKKMRVNWGSRQT